MPSTWQLTQTFLNPTPATSDWFGNSVAISDNNVLVGANGDDTGAIGAGAAYLFDGTTGNLLRTFLNPTPATDDYFGNSVGISGNNVLVGAFFDDTGATDTGAAYLFDGTTGSLLRTFLKPTPANSDLFGESVAISGNNVLVGADGDDTGATNAGAAYLFNGTTGTLLQTFFNPTPSINDFFGRSVAISGNNVLVGADRDDTRAIDAGAAYLFNGATGSLLQTFLNPTPSINDFFGYSVAISGDNVLVGAFSDDTGATDAGAAYLFDGTTGSLLHTFLNPTPANDDWFGYSVAISGNNILVGAFGDGTQAREAGAAYLFDGTTGSLLQTFLNPTPAINDIFGYSVAISGNNVLVGAFSDNTGATDAGAAYLFQLVDTATLSINDVTVTEGNSGTTNATFTVTLSNPVSTVVSVDYATANGTATAGNDYVAIPTTTLTFNPNETTKTITVQVNGDNQVELNETFFVNLSNLQGNGSNVTLADNQGQGTITNNDSATISINDVTVAEGNSGTTNAVFTVNLSNAVDTAVTLNYATANGTATTADNDYNALPTTALTFNPGETSKTITVPINGDTKVEGNETFLVNLSSLNPNGRNVTLADNQGQGTINNDDSNKILGTPGRDTLIGTPQDDIITGLQGADILTGGGGKDQFVYQNIRDAGDIITDFEIGQDKIVLTSLLNSLNYTGSNAIADGYFQFGTRGSDTVILIDEDGNGTIKYAKPFITVQNVSVSAMQSPSNFIF